jgi:hypothetical protein
MAKREKHLAKHHACLQVLSYQPPCKAHATHFTFDEGADWHDTALVLQNVLSKCADGCTNGPVGVPLAHMLLSDFIKHVTNIDALRQSSESHTLSLMTS